MATTLEIIQGINQAAANAYDGSHDERFVTGDAKKIGLSREEGCPIVDSRISDGFGVKIIGDMLQINYEANVRLSDVYAVGFEEECERRIQAIADFLRKEYKLITGSTLSNSISFTLRSPNNQSCNFDNLLKTWHLMQDLPTISLSFLNTFVK